jgi:hypothetical protein
MAKKPMKIKIKRPGKLTNMAKKAKRTVPGEAQAIKNNPKATNLQKKEAQFAINAAKWNHGGNKKGKGK